MRVLAAILMLVCAVPSAAITILVDGDGTGDFLTITEGMEAASYGDTVAVMPGVYSDIIWVDMHDPMSIDATAVVMKDGVTLLSTDGPDSTTIEAWGMQAAVFFDGCGPESVIRGFTIENSGEGYGLRTSILCYASSPLIDSNVMAGWFDGVCCKQLSSPSIINNIIGDGPVAFAGGSGGTVANNRIEGYISVSTNTALPLDIDSNVIGVERGQGDRARESLGIGVGSGGPGEVTIRDNSIRGKDIGAWLCRGTLIHNRFGGNAVNVEVYWNCAPWEDINAESNWWGTTDPEEIEAKIVDCNDDPALESCVDFVPWCLDEECTQTAAAASSWSAVKALFR